MKIKLFACVLALLLFILPLLTACTQAGAALHFEPRPDDGKPARSRQFGQTDALVRTEGDFSYVVLYPQTGYEAMDAAILSWVQMAVDDAVGRKSMSDDARLGGELMVNYDSYLVNDRIVSIAQTGQYVSRGTALPVDIAYTLNYDLLEERIVPPIELIPFTSHPHMFELIGQKLLEQSPELDVAAIDMNLLWLEPLVLTPHDVRLIISGESNPLMALGINELVFSYEELEGILLLPGEYEAVPAGTPEKPSETPPEMPPVAQISTQPEEIDPEKPMIALSFDDGPGKVTDQLLDLLERYNVPATFFIIGRQAADYPDTLKRMAEQGCEMASHTWDHPDLARQTREGIIEQIDKTADAIEAAAGVRPRLLRPPYGSVSTQVRDISKELDIYLVNWSIDTLDWKTRDSHAIYEHIMSHAFAGGIILCHDLYPSTIEAMEMAIPALLEKGYQFVTVGQLLGLDEGLMVSGTVYRSK